MLAKFTAYYADNFIACNNWFRRKSVLRTRICPSSFVWTVHHSTVKCKLYNLLKCNKIIISIIILKYNLISNMLPCFIFSNFYCLKQMPLTRGLIQKGNYLKGCFILEQMLFYYNSGSFVSLAILFFKLVYFRKIIHHIYIVSLLQTSNYPD